jgi:hypothetical protein
MPSSTCTWMAQTRGGASNWAAALACQRDMAPRVISWKLKGFLPEAGTLSRSFPMVGSETAKRKYLVGHPKGQAKSLHQPRLGVQDPAKFLGDPARWHSTIQLRLASIWGDSLLGNFAMRVRTAVRRVLRCTPPPQVELDQTCRLLPHPAQRPPRPAASDRAPAGRGPAASRDCAEQLPSSQRGGAAPVRREPWACTPSNVRSAWRGRMRACRTRLVARSTPCRTGGSSSLRVEVGGR